MFRRWPWPKLIGIFFATVWGVIGSLALSRPWWAPAIAASLATSMALLIWVGRNKATQSGLFRRDAYKIAVGAELAAICRCSGHSQQVGAALILTFRDWRHCGAAFYRFVESEFLQEVSLHRFWNVRRLADFDGFTLPAHGCASARGGCRSRKGAHSMGWSVPVIPFG